MCLAVLAGTALVVVGGQQTAGIVARAVEIWLAGFDARYTRLSGPILAGVYQLGFLWLVATWATGERRRDALALVWPSLKAWHWGVIVVGLYAVKAIATVIAVWLTHSGGGVAAQPGAMPVEGLAPFAAIMRSPAWVLLLAGGIIAAIVEELLYRGFLSRTLENSRLGFWGGALLASVVWAGLHVYYPLSIQAVLVVVGLALSLLRAKTGSVYPGMLWHVVNNSVGLLAMRFLM